MNRDLMLSILAMDSYNRGYGVGVKGLDGHLKIGNASIKSDSSALGTQSGQRVDANAGFYAIAYTYNGEKIIGYRGTDDLIGTDSDIINGYALGGGLPYVPQAMLALNFFKAVAGTNQDPYAANITTTGHSLGGGLAGFVASVYGKRASVFDTMSFQLAAYTFTSSDVQHPADGSRIDARQTNGQVIDGFPLNQGVSGIPEYSYNAFSEGYGRELSAVQKHSAALLVDLIYADTMLSNTYWWTAAPYMWNSYFNDDVAATITAAADRTGDTGTPLQTLQSAIAYSAIDEGTRPFGDTGIVAMFDDATDLGRALTNVAQGSLLTLVAPRLADSMVAFAGKLALGGIGGGAASVLANGVLSLSQDAKTLAVDYASGLWSRGASSTKSVGQAEVLSETLTFPVGTGNVLGWISAGMAGLYTDATASTIDRIIFSAANGPLSVGLEDRVAGRGGKRSLFVASDASDHIIGAGGQEVIVGAGGNDVIDGGAGNDLITGNDGDDQLSGSDGNDWLEGNDGDDRLDGGAGTDTLYGGDGVDRIEGGAGNDTLYGDDGDDLLYGGAGSDTIYGGAGFDTLQLSNLDGSGGPVNLTLSRIAATAANPVGLRATNGYTGDIERFFEVEALALSAFDDVVNIVTLGPATLAGQAVSPTPVFKMIDYIDFLGGDNLLNMTAITRNLRVDFSDTQNQTVNYLNGAGNSFNTPIGHGIVRGVRRNGPVRPGIPPASAWRLGNGRCQHHDSLARDCAEHGRNPSGRRRASLSLTSPEFCSTYDLHQ